MRRVPFVLFGAAVVALTGCAGSGYTIKSPLAVYEDAQVFQPLKYPAPGEAWYKKHLLGAEDAWFIAEDGAQLHGWYLPHDDPVGIALFAHGNAGNVATQADTLRELRDRHKLSVMTFDYRGYGRSESYPSESGIIDDARQARAWLARREKIDEQDIILIGHSLGGGVMVDLAARDGARGLILASTFTSLPDVAEYHAPLLPVKSLMHNRMNSLSKIGEYHGRLLQIHGDQDEVIPHALGQQLFEAANQPKEFVTKSGAGHNDPMSETERKAIDRFLASLPPPRSAAETDRVVSQIEPSDRSVGPRQ